MDSNTDGTDHDGKVLLAMARAGWCGVMTIDKSEYSLDTAPQLGNMLGFPPSPPQTAAERARKARAVVA